MLHYVIHEAVTAKWDNEGKRARQVMALLWFAAQMHLWLVAAGKRCEPTSQSVHGHQRIEQITKWSGFNLCRLMDSY